MNSFAQLQAVAELVPGYLRLRAERPLLPASVVVAFLRDPADCNSIDEFTCNHDFVCTGTEYGGDDESYHGEGRCYCVRCGKDGDA